MTKGKAFVINLKNAVERRNNIIAQLKEYHIDFEIVEAIEGKNLFPETNSEIDWDYATKNASWISKGLLACTLSHLKAYKQILEENLDYALVLEDDTVIYPEVEEFLKKAGNYIKANEIIMLYYASWTKCTLTLKENTSIGIKDYKIVNAHNPEKLVSANAYIITKEACESIIKFQSPLKATSDSWKVFLNSEALHGIRCIYPMMADTADFKSTIDYVDTKSMIGKTLSAIDKYKIFPFYHILKNRRRKMRMAMLNFEVVND